MGLREATLGLWFDLRINVDTSKERVDAAPEAGVADAIPVDALSSTGSEDAEGCSRPHAHFESQELFSPRIHRMPKSFWESHFYPDAQRAGDAEELGKSRAGGAAEDYYLTASPLQ